MVERWGDGMVDPITRNVSRGRMKRPIRRLQRRAHEGGWQDTFVVRASNAAYGEATQE